MTPIVTRPPLLWALVSTALLAGAWPGLPTRAQTPAAAPQGGASGVLAPAVEMPSPVADRSQAYALTAGADGRTYLTWLEPVGGDAHALKFSTLNGTVWAPAREIARGANWFVNWADHPALTASADGTLFAHWLVHTGRAKGSYGYGVQVARSTDGGQTWARTFTDGIENVADYAGFVAFVPNATGADAVFLRPEKPDVPGPAGPGHEGHGGEDEHIKTVAVVSFGGDGRPGPIQTVDADACTCCMTDIARAADGLVAVFRDHQPGEIRDIAVVRQVKGRWTSAVPVARDGWKIPGCPTNGPAIAARGRQVVVAWFTAAGNTPRLKWATSSDGGATFGSPVVVDAGAPVGYPDLVLLADGSSVVSWLERKGEGVGDVMVRRVSAAGVASPPVAVARSVSGRGTGVPHLVRAGTDLLVAWRKDRVQTARVSLAALPR